MSSGKLNHSTPPEKHCGPSCNREGLLLDLMALLWHNQG